MHRVRNKTVLGFQFWAPLMIIWGQVDMFRQLLGQGGGERAGVGGERAGEGGGGDGGGGGGL